MLWLLALGAVGAAAYYFLQGHAPQNAPFTALTLMGTQQSITAPRGKLVAIQAPDGGQVVSVAPAQGTVGRLSQQGGIGYAALAQTGDVNVTWRAPDGSPQATVVHVVAT